MDHAHRVQTTARGQSRWQFRGKTVGHPGSAEHRAGVGFSLYVMRATGELCLEGEIIRFLNSISQSSLVVLSVRSSSQGLGG